MPSPNNMADMVQIVVHTCPYCGDCTESAEISGLTQNDRYYCAMGHEAELRTPTATYYVSQESLRSEMLEGPDY